MQTSEKYIEKYLRLKVEELGGKALKWVSPGFNGVPDRIILLPQGKIYFVETKSTGDKPRPIQLWVHKLLRKLGFEVFVIDNIEQVDKFISYVINSN